MPIIKKETDGFTAIERRGEKMIQSSIFDGKGFFLKDEKDELLYNNTDGIDEKGKEIEPTERLEKILEVSQKTIGGLLIWSNFKKPEKKLIRITEFQDLYDCLCVSNKFISLGYVDNTIIFNTQKLLKELGLNSLSLGGAVADCAGICGNYNNGEIISISHAGWQGITNGVIEQLIYTYMAELGKKEFQKVQFDFSPMAGINYEWDKISFNKILIDHVSYLNFEKKKIEQEIKYIRNSLDKIAEFKSRHDTRVEKMQKDYKSYSDTLSKIEQELGFYKEAQTFLKIAEDYNIDFMKDKIVEKSSDPSKVIFFLDRLIKRIFLENGASIEQLNFHKEYTTDLNNSWPSYRIHTLGKEGIISPNMTVKGKNGSIPNSRLGVFNTVYKK